MNDRFPGLPDYVGPTSGWFTFLHHEVPFEYSPDVMVRIAYINSNKPANEVPTRLRHIVYVSDVMPPARAEYERVKAPARAEYERVMAQAWADVGASAAALIPNCSWDGKSLVFPEAQ